MVLILENACLSSADKVLLDNVDLVINEGNKIGIIGNNGVGKSCLLKAICEKIDLEKGKIIKEKNTKIAYLSQKVEIEDNNISINDYIKDYFKDYKPVEFENIDVQIKSNLNKLKIYDTNRLMHTLSGGEKRRVMLALTLASTCDLLVLDEPTNHLDNEMVEWLEKYLIKFNKSILMVTHDRYFLNNVCNMIACLDNGKLSCFIANFEKYLLLKEEENILNNAINRKRRSFLKKEISWIQRGALARTTKDKRRIENYDVEFKKYKESMKTQAKLDMNFTNFPRLGNIIIEAKDVSKSFDGKKIIDNFTYILNENDRIGIVGANGSGKSTLLNILSGKVNPDNGEVIRGLTVKVGYFTQENENFDLNLKTIDYICDHQDELYASNLLEKFLFTKDMQAIPINKLSGGEKRRLRLLKVLATNPNVLFLDEPTNDLDIETLNVLEDYILAFSGPVLIVSHDRYFLDKVVDKIIEIKDDGKINFYLGNYQAYLEKREISKVVKENKEINVVKKESNKLSFNEKREYENILFVIDDLEQEKKALEKEINDLYISEDAFKYYKEIKEKEEKIKALNQLIEEKVSRWEYLEGKEKRS